MKVSIVKFFVLSMLCVLLMVTTSVTARPGNHWSPSDSRCGTSQRSFRIGKRSATSNGSGNYYKFNGNSGSCEKYYGNPQHDHNAFYSKKDCDQACLNIYHFSG